MVARWLRDRIAASRNSTSPSRIVRAFHTLRGAALAVGAKPVGDLAGSLEAYLDTLNKAHQSLTVPGLALIDDSVAALSEWIKKVGEPAELPDARPWIDRVDAIAPASSATKKRAGRRGPSARRGCSPGRRSTSCRSSRPTSACGRATPSATSQARMLKTTIHTLRRGRHVGVPADRRGRAASTCVSTA